jgi:hypothetical protein
LRQCLVELVCVLRQRGLAAALAAVQKDPAIHWRYQAAARGLLAAVDQADHQAR